MRHHVFVSAEVATDLRPEAVIGHFVDPDGVGRRELAMWTKEGLDCGTNPGIVLGFFRDTVECVRSNGCGGVYMWVAARTLVEASEQEPRDLFLSVYDASVGVKIDL